MFTTIPISYCLRCSRCLCRHATLLQTSNHCVKSLAIFLQNPALLILKKGSVSLATKSLERFSTLRTWTLPVNETDSCEGINITFSLVLVHY